MQKFKCIATTKAANKKSTTFKSVTFSVVAENFKAALLKAERKAKKIFIFESLKVTEQ